MGLSHPAAAVGRAPPAFPGAGVVAGSEEQLREEARFLHWFGQDIVSFNRGYVDIAGGNVVAALWLSFVLERMPQEVRAQRAVMTGDRYSFTMTGAECEHSTGITRAQQASCRRHLQVQGLLDVDAQRGRTVTYTVHLDQLRTRMAEQAQPLLAALRRPHADGPAPTPLAIRARRGR